MSDYQTRQTLLQRISSGGDEQSWEEFVHYYQTFIYIVCKKINLTHHQADEVTQQVLIKLWEKFPNFKYDSSKSFRSWLYKVVQNTSYDYFRKLRSQNNLKSKVQEQPNENITLSELEKLAEKEWNDYLSSLALENIRKDFSPETIDIFLRLLDGEDARKLEEEYGLQRKVIYVYSKRVRDRLKIEYRKLAAELD